MAEVVAIPQGGQLVEAGPVVERIKQQIKRGREAQKEFHPTWRSNLAFASGQQWLVWHDTSRSLRSIQVMDPRYRHKELYTADKIGESRLAVLGEMGSDDDRPELLLARDDRTGEDYQAAANRAVQHGWDNEWLGSERIAELDELVIDLGTAAMRCRFDPTVGPVAYENVPHRNGKPIHNKQEQLQAVAAAAMGQGEALSFKDVPAGRICWEPYSAFGIIAPAGVARESKFPFDCLVAPVSLNDLKREFGDITVGLREDADILSTLGEATVGAPGSGASREKNRLRGYVWLFTYFERPTSSNPKGRVFYLAGNQMKLLRVDQQLPYLDSAGDYCSGIVYFHWWRVSGRFFSRSLIEAMKDGQRRKNKLATQRNEIIDRGMPKWFGLRSQQGARTNEIMEKIELEPGEPAPTVFQGFGPGDWMYREDEQIDNDLRAATGITEPTLGINPASVTNYSQLAALQESSQVKRQVIYRDRKQGIAKLVELSLYDIRSYWGPEKQIKLAGDDDQLEVEAFNASKLPPSYTVRTPTGATKPRSQSGELQKVQDIWTAAVAVGVTMSNPDAWINWYKDSLEHGQALELPDSGSDDQQAFAQFENHLMREGMEVEPRDWHPPEIHVPAHRLAQAQADAAGDTATYNRLELHIQRHLEMAKANQAAAQAGIAPGAGAVGPQAAPAQGQPAGQGDGGIMQLQDAARMARMQQPPGP